MDRRSFPDPGPPAGYGPAVAKKDPDDEEESQSASGPRSFPDPGPPAGFGPAVKAKTSDDGSFPDPGPPDGYLDPDAGKPLYLGKKREPPRQPTTAAGVALPKASSISSVDAMVKSGSKYGAPKPLYLGKQAGEEPETSGVPISQQARELGSAFGEMKQHLVDAPLDVLDRPLKGPREWLQSHDTGLEEPAYTAARGLGIPDNAARTGAAAVESGVKGGVSGLVSGENMALLATLPAAPPRMAAAILAKFSAGGSVEAVKAAGELIRGWSTMTPEERGQLAGQIASGGLMAALPVFHALMAKHGDGAAGQPPRDEQRPAPPPLAPQEQPVGQSPESQGLPQNLKVLDRPWEGAPPNVGQPPATDLAGQSPVQPAAPEPTNPDLRSVQGASGVDVANTEASAQPVSPVASEAGRRVDPARRQLVAEMTEEQKATALLTNEVTDLPNRRAFNEAEQREPAGAIGMSDSDALKALNDTHSYDSGDAMLRAKAEALRQAGLEAYHEKGDEFLYRAQSPEELHAGLERARTILRESVFAVDFPDGTTKYFKGADFSFGVGDSKHAAERVLKEHKASREAAGERARGELRGVREVTAEGEPIQVQPGSEESAADPESASEPATTEVAEPERKFASTQVDLPKPLADKVRALGASIPDELLAKDGREDNPHATVRFGFHSDDPEPVHRLLASEPAANLTLGPLDLFRAPEHDVLIAPVESPDLHRLNGKLGELEHTDTHPEYKPHVTIAYLKPGEGEQFVGHRALAGEKASIDKVTFSGSDKVDHEIPLKKAITDVTHEDILRHTVGLRDRADIRKNPPSPEEIADARETLAKEESDAGKPEQAAEPIDVREGQPARLGREGAPEHGEAANAGERLPEHEPDEAGARSPEPAPGGRGGGSAEDAGPVASAPLSPLRARAKATRDAEIGVKTRQNVRDEAIKAKMGTPAQVDAWMKVLDRTADYWAKNNAGKHAMDFFAEKMAGVTKDAPESAAVNQPVYQHGIASTTFFSQAIRTIEQKMPNAATPEQVRGILSPANGVKAEELEWIGLDDILNGKTKVTKQDVLDHLRANQVEVKPVVLGGDSANRQIRLERAEKDLQQFMLMEGLTESEANNYALDAARGGLSESQLRIARANSRQWELVDDLQHVYAARKEGDSRNAPKFGKYTLPGGENYREVLLTKPPTKVEVPQWKIIRPDGHVDGTFASEESARIQAERRGEGYTVRNDPPKTVDGGFRSSHFDEPNILAHLRMNDRVDAEGKKTLFVEEVQSDWHQKGREQGYAGKSAWRDWAAADGMDESAATIGRLELAGAPDAVIRDFHENALRRSPVPDAPFKKTWPELAFKWALRHAVENGYEKIAWTTGEQQAERYDLSKQVRSIEWEPHDRKANTKLVVIRPTAGNVIELRLDEHGVAGGVSGGRSGSEFDGKHITDIVGKELGNRIVSDSHGDLSGNGLKIGGGGMAGFYDQILPATVNKLVKKWGGKVEPAEIEGPTTTVWTVLDKDRRPVPYRDENGASMYFPTEEAALAAARETNGTLSKTIKDSGTVHSIEITPAMREGAMAGQPLFQRGSKSAVEPHASPLRKAMFERWFKGSKVVDDAGAPKVVYHGTARPDRVGSQFKKSRATSGPMAFFTDDPEIGSKYTEKADTSLNLEDRPYESWFQFKPKGSRSTVNIDRAWWHLSPEERATISERAPHVTADDDGNVIYDPKARSGVGGFDQHLKEARGNPLKALTEEWLSSAQLYDTEEKFSDVLKLAGMPMDRISEDFPHATSPAVYPVHLSIKNPLVTDSIPESVIASLQSAANRQRRPAREIGADPWDKNTRDPQQWMQELRKDLSEGKNSFVWTSIPDWVTKTLRSAGYDGIHDTGGKMGGGAGGKMGSAVEHSVWIPFDETQIKSATGNRGTFDPTDPNILHQGGKGQPKGALSFLEDGRALIHALSKPDISTLLHEGTHLFESVMSSEDRATVEKVYGENALSTVKGKERFAEDGERYFANGKSPVPELKGVFEKFREWLTDVYRGVKNSLLGKKIHPDIEKVFDKWMRGGEEARAATDDVFRKELKDETPTGAERDEIARRANAELVAAQGGAHPERGPSGRGKAPVPLAERGQHPSERTVPESELEPARAEAGGPDRDQRVPAAAEDEAGLPRSASRSVPAEGHLTQPAPEAEEPESVGIKNAESAKIREAQDMGPRHGPEPRTQEAMYDAGKAAAEADPTAIPRLLDELRKDPERILGTEQEAGLFLKHRVDLENQLQKLVAEKNAAHADGDTEAEGLRRLQLAAHREAISEFVKLAERTGTATGRALAARKMMSALDYSLSAMETGAEAAKGSSLTDAELARIRGLHEELQIKLKAVETDAAASRERAAKAEADLHHVQLRFKAAGPLGERILGQMDTAADAARARLRERGFRAAAGLDPTELADLTIIGAKQIAHGLADLAEWSDSMVTMLGEKMRPHLQEVFDASERKLEETISEAAGASKAPRILKKVVSRVEAPGERVAPPKDLAEKIGARLKGGDSLADLRPYLREMALGVIRSGVTGREAVLSVLHAAIEKVAPGYSKAEVRDALSGYGQFRPLDPAVDKTRLREINAEAQKLAQLEALNEGKAPLATGFERPEPNDETRRLTKEVNEAKKKAGIITGQDAEGRLKSALASAKTRIRNTIKDLQTEIDTGQRTISGKSVPVSDAELDTLRAQLTDLRKTEKEVFGKTEMTDEQRLAMAIRSAKGNVDRWNDRVARAKAGDFANGKAPRLLGNPEMDALRAQANAARAEYEELSALDPGQQKSRDVASNLAYRARLAARKADLLKRIAEQDVAPQPPRPAKVYDTETMRLKADVERTKAEYQAEVKKFEQANRTTPMKVRDAFISYVRAGALSWPTVIAKLSSVALSRIVTTPLTDFAALGVAKALPGLAKGAPRYGARSASVALRAEAAGLASMWRDGLHDSGQMLFNRPSSLTMLYGKHKAPHAWYEYFGSLHGALKEPVRRAEFTRSLYRRTVEAMERGEDVTNEFVQLRLANESYLDGERSVAMNDNVITTAWNRGLAALEEKAKATGKPNPLGTLLATAMKVEMPIVKAPTNVIIDASEYIGGLLVGPARAAWAYAHGIEGLAPVERDSIIRMIAKGAVGAAIMGLYFYKHDDVEFGGFYHEGEKRKSTDVPQGAARIYGQDIPKMYLHNPMLMAGQFAASVARVAPTRHRKKDEDPVGYWSATGAATLGLIDETPIAGSLMRDVKDLKKGPSQMLAKKAANIAVPGVVQWIATKTDDPAIKRTPHGLAEELKSRIPGLRGDVPEDFAKEYKSLKTRHAEAVKELDIARKAGESQEAVREEYADVLAPGVMAAAFNRAKASDKARAALEAK